jgi:hypothetical protein
VLSVLVSPAGFLHEMLPWCPTGYSE